MNNSTSGMKCGVNKESLTELEQKIVAYPHYRSYGTATISKMSDESTSTYWIKPVIYMDICPQCIQAK